MYLKRKIVLRTIWYLVAFRRDRAMKKWQRVEKERARERPKQVLMKSSKCRDDRGVNDERCVVQLTVCTVRT